LNCCDDDDDDVEEFGCFRFLLDIGVEEDEDDDDVHSETMTDGAEEEQDDDDNERETLCFLVEGADADEEELHLRFFCFFCFFSFVTTSCLSGRTNTNKCADLLSGLLLSSGWYSLVGKGCGTYDS